MGFTVYHRDLIANINMIESNKIKCRRLPQMQVKMICASQIPNYSFYNLIVWFKRVMHKVVVNFFEKMKKRENVLILKKDNAKKGQASRQDKEKTSKLQVFKFKQQKEPTSQELGNSDNIEGKWLEVIKITNSED